MSNAALKIDRVEGEQHGHLYVACTETCGYPSSTLPRADFWTANRMSILTAILIVLQILDGVLTCTGMYTFGLHAEANPVLRGLMGVVGIIPAVAITKLLCMAVIYTLCAQAHRISWLPSALAGVGCVYAVAAVLPWSWLLLTEYLA
jgi:hypothetical protein